MTDQPCERCLAVETYLKKEIVSLETDPLMSIAESSTNAKLVAAFRKIIEMMNAGFHSKTAGDELEKRMRPEEIELLHVRRATVLLKRAVEVKSDEEMLQLLPLFDQLLVEGSETLAPLAWARLRFIARDLQSRVSVNQRIDPSVQSVEHWQYHVARHIVDAQIAFGLEQCVPAYLKEVHSAFRNA